MLIEVPYLNHPEFLNWILTPASSVSRITALSFPSLKPTSSPGRTALERFALSTWMQAWVLAPFRNSLERILVVSPISKYTPSAGSVLGQHLMVLPRISSTMAHVLKGLSLRAAKKLRINLKLFYCKKINVSNGDSKYFKSAYVPCWFRAPYWI